MSLPETTIDDLRCIGITPEAIKAQFERFGRQIEGKIVGYLLPDDGWSGDSRIRRARNNLKTDWHVVKQSPPKVILEEENKEAFQTFDGDVPMDVTYQHNARFTAGDDYTQTQGFGISVNANIPLGRSGPLEGFDASLTAKEVRSRSKTESTTQDISFPLTVPAHEGRIVCEKTTVTSTEIIYESTLRAEGTIGLEVDPGHLAPNVYYFFYNVEFIFPHAEATSRITRVFTSTDIDAKVIKMAKLTDAKIATDEKDAEILEYIPFIFDQPAALESPEDLGVVISSEAKDSAADPNTVLANLKVRIQFAGVKPEVPPQNRRAGATTFRGRVQYSDIEFRRPPSAVTYAPKDISASFSLTYDPAVISKEKLKSEVTKKSKAVQWKGKVKLYFS